VERVDNNIRFEFAQGQIKRLAGLEDYPRWVPEAVNELAVIAVKWAYRNGTSRGLSTRYAKIG